MATLVFLPLLVAACQGTPGHPTAKVPLPSGAAQVADILPHHDGLQYCVNLRARNLAPAGARNVIIHSLSAYVATKDPNQPALLAIRGRYPGWDTPGTTIYNQSFTNTNTVWLEILHEFPLGVACIEVYGRGLTPSQYSAFKNKILVSFSYLPVRGPGYITQKLVPIHWGRYLSQYSPRVRPKH